MDADEPRLGMELARLIPGRLPVVCGQALAETARESRSIMETSHIYLRGDRRVHLLRILKPDTHYSEGACGLQGEIASITDDPLTCDDCIGRVARQSVEMMSQPVRSPDAIAADFNAYMSSEEN